MNKKQRTIAALLLSVCLAGATPLANADFDVDAWAESLQGEADVNALARLYLDMSIQLNPPTGGALGIHGTEENPGAFDDHLADMSPAAWDTSYRAHVSFRDRLAAIDASTLSRAGQIDLHILKNDVA